MSSFIRFGLLALALSGGGIATADSPLPVRLEARAPAWRAAMDSLGIPGLAVAAVRGDSVVWTGTYGWRDAERRLPVTRGTMFYIASCTKPFVATLAADLAARNAIDLDAPVRTYANRFALADPVATDTLTLRDLLCHRPGLRNGTIGWAEAYTGQIDDDKFWRLLARTNPRKSPSYANLNFTTAARAIEARTGKHWKDLLESQLFAPAGMTRTTCSASRLLADPDAAIPYSRIPGGIVPSPVRKADRTMHAAGGMASTLDDLTRWLRLELGGGVINGRRVLAPGVASSTWDLQAASPDRHPFSPRHTRVGYGLGWELREYRGTRVLAHNGSYEGAGAAFALLPDAGAGVVVLANGTAGVALCEAVAMEVEDALLGREPEDPTGRLIELGSRMFGPLRADTARGSLALPASAYAGTYANADWGTLEVAAHGDSIAGRVGALPMPFHLTGRDRFRVRGEYAGEFEKDARGKVVAVWMNMDPDSVRFVKR